MFDLGQIICLLSCCALLIVGGVSMAFIVGRHRGRQEALDNVIADEAEPRAPAQDRVIIVPGQIVVPTNQIPTQFVGGARRAHSPRKRRRVSKRWW